MSRQPLVVIVGQTAAGKSSIAMSVAQRFEGEIICADSWTVYKGLDIGTAKPTLEDQALVPHHVLDVVEPGQRFTAVDFKQLATEAMADIHRRGRLPIIVGGNGLYIDSVLRDYSFMPAGTPEERRRLQALSLKELINEAEGQGIDLTGIDTRNSRRVIRAIESGGKRPTSQPLRKDTLVLGARRDRRELRQRMEQRIDQMFAKGLQHEVKELVDEYGWEVEALKAIGYREFRPFMEGQISKNELKRKILRSTLRDLAKRQRSWFKKNPQIIWVDDIAAALDKVEHFLKKPE